jgi:hypothetical protein
VAISAVRERATIGGAATSPATGSSASIVRGGGAGIATPIWVTRRSLRSRRGGVGTGTAAACSSVSAVSRIVTASGPTGASGGGGTSTTRSSPSTITVRARPTGATVGVASAWRASVENRALAWPPKVRAKTTCQRYSGTISGWTAQSSSSASSSRAAMSTGS